jgi:hypothetical protein
MIGLRGKWLMPAGGICLAVAVFADRLLVLQTLAVNLIIGILTGISLAFSLAGLYRMRRIR